MKLYFLLFALVPSLVLAEFYAFNDPRFVTDPFGAVHNYDDKADLDADIRDAEVRYGKLAKAQTNAELQKQVDDVYEGLRRQYPKFMANKAKPPIVIVDVKDATTLSAYAGQLIKRHGIIVVSTGFIESNKSRPAKLGFLAHELSHLYLGHGRYGVDSRVIQVKYANGEKLTPKEAHAAIDYVNLNRLVGDLHFKEANGISFGTDMGTGYEGFIDSLYSEKTASCGPELKQSLKSLANQIQPNYSEYQAVYRFDTSESRETLDKNTKQITTLINGCLKSLPPEKNSIGLSFATKAALRRAGMKHNVLDDSSKAATFEEYLALNRQAVDLMQKKKNDFSLPQLRTYTTEDQADEAAVGVLVSMGVSPKDYVNAFIEETPKSKSKCETEVSEGREPPFGDLSDSHHSFCWRYYNTSRFAKSDNPRIDGLAEPIGMKPLKTSR